MCHRLKNTNRDLQCKGFLEKYDQLLKLKSTTTPIRAVFGGSCMAKGRYSLNDCLDRGPNMLELIPPILFRLRLKKIGVLADIKRAFQQVSIIPLDRDYLRFLWWNYLSCKEL